MLPVITDEMFESGKLVFTNIESLQEGYETAMCRLGGLFITGVIEYGEYVHRLNALHDQFMVYLRTFAKKN